MSPWNTTSNPGQVFGDIPHIAGRFYDSRVNTTVGTIALAANTLYGVPFYVPQGNTYTALACEITTTQANSTVRMGIYNDGGGVPSTLVLDAGTVSAITTGGKTISISQYLPAGWYWLAAVSNTIPNVRAIVTTNALPSLGFSSGTDTVFHVGYSGAFTFGALPTPFTTGALMASHAIRLMLGL